MDVMTHSSTFLLPGNDHGSSVTYALVVLNQRLPRFTPILWDHAQVRVCADGGANRVFDEMPLLFPRDDALDVRHRYKPDIIKGDMDSIRTEVLDFYTNLGTKVVDESHDQDTTDLHKCVAYIRDFAPNLDKSNLCILVAAALGGRFDHEAANINGPHCGLIPIGMASVGTTTTGLQWDLTNTEMRFGDLVSTSNLVQGEKITVQSSSDLLWTISIKKV
ncbi:thiamine pyrophosphokinase 1-like isoform X2 [Populus alba x Populus x berolinensis]|uniref:thiamine diphosphokinase n=1 Tax=Populus alba x Populus x berolinensis TaxID=444605 RepID=A0AAD6RFY2_9ROSI|nr:thiamine pyrophosphokinase 1-like isoform X2 [Populus alba x Populus x berolinensis]